MLKSRAMFAVIVHLASLALFGVTPVSASAIPPSNCRTLPGDPTFPSSHQWAQLNASVDGRLVAVVPSAKFCVDRVPPCTEAEWQSTVYRATIPGAMDIVNWEQDYTSNPPSLCLRNGTTCGQGNVPVYTINVTEVRHAQAGLAFASRHNLKLAIKSSGHDFLGRSTARGSLLIWTHYLNNITFTDNFTISNGDGGVKDLGSAVTVGGGVPLNTLYRETKNHNKMYVGGSSASVTLAGGYVQGGGHSAFSPKFGLGADNALEFKVVLANGAFVTANELENPDLFWALRGGGGGTWGVVISATVRTYPAFQAVFHSAAITVPSSGTPSLSDLMTLHARHIFDWDELRAGQYFYLFSGTDPSNPGVGATLTFETYFADVSGEAAFESMLPLLNDARNAGFIVVGDNATESVQEGLANDLMFVEDVSLGLNSLLTSRLIPETVYRSEDGPAAIGSGYARLLNEGTPYVLGHLLAGGKVSENANIDSAVQPKWRTAKTFIIATTTFPDTLSPAEVVAFKENFTTNTTSILISMTGESDSGTYMNEADVREPDFVTTFFGEKNYQRLSQVKSSYDPTDMFIVGAGVGSERWDTDGLCRRV